MKEYAMRMLLTAIVGLVFTFTYAQKFEVVNYQEKHPSSGEVFSFPVLKSSTNAAVAKKINDKMQNEQLEQLIDPVKKGAFSKIWSGSLSGTTELGYELLQNNDRFFSVRINAMGCGAYCEGYSVSYNFDAKSGNPISAGDLFTAAGASFLGRYVSCKRNKMITDVVSKLEKSLKSPSATNKEDLETARDMYKECKAGDTEVASFEYARVELGTSAITLITERCSNHAMAALDELGDFVYAIPAKDFGACLTQYGNDLMMTGRKESQAYKSFGGTINNTIKISMLLEVPAGDQNIEGVYFYDRVAGLIKLKGSKAGNKLTIIESDDKGVKTGTFELVISGDALTGKWINPKTLKEMPVKLAKN